MGGVSETHPITAMMSEFAMTTPDAIQIDPAICHGKPVIRGTRVPVTIVLGSLAGGMSLEEVQQEYDLTREDIQAALGFSRRVAGSRA